MDSQVEGGWNEPAAPPATEQLLSFALRWRPSDLKMFAALGIPRPGEWLLVHSFIQRPGQKQTYDYLLLTNERLVILSFAWTKLRYKLTEFPRSSLRLGFGGTRKQQWIVAAGPGKAITFRAHSASSEMRRAGFLAALTKLVGL
jgi:hypothetical protein